MSCDDLFVWWRLALSSVIAAAVLLVCVTIAVVVVITELRDRRRDR